MVEPDVIAFGVQSFSFAELRLWITHGLMKPADKIFISGLHQSVGF
jgi:hypothetical protein